MLNRITYALSFFILFFFGGCAVKTPVKNEYQLSQFSHAMVKVKSPSTTILITPPEAAVGYETEQMLYMIKPYELTAYTYNAWVGAPAAMLFPLMIQSLQKSNFFYAVTSTPYSDKADYRLDSHLIALEQRFLNRPSTLHMTIKAVLSHIRDNRIVASHIFDEQVPCPMDTPYGGVIAANQATEQFTKKLTYFVTSHIVKDYASKS